MNEYSTVNILDMMDAIGEDALAGILSSFACPINTEIETFVRKKAINFAKSKISITYLILNNATGDIISIFSLTHKALDINGSTLSKTDKKRFERFARTDEENGIYKVSAFLIAQFGKNYAVEQPEDWNGIRLMEKTFETLAKVQHQIGGGVVYLECEDEPKLLEFYQNSQNHFKVFDVRDSESENITYKQLFRFF